MTRSLLRLVPLVLVFAFLLFLSATDGLGRAGGAAETGGVAVEAHDSDGRPFTLHFAHPPEWVLITYPGATELLLDLGLGSRVVATLKPYGTEPPRYRAAYDDLPKLSAPFVPSREEVADLAPDLIMGWSHHFTVEALGDVRSYAAHGIAAYIVPATVRKGAPTLEDTVYPFIEDVGRMFDIEPEARTYEDGLRARVERVEARAEARGAHPSAIILQSHGNSRYTLYGANYLVTDLAAKAGVENLSERTLSSVGPEQVLAFDPDVIFFVKAKDETDEAAEAELLAIGDFARMRAVAGRRIIVVDFADINNGNGRTVDALEKIADGLDRLEE